MPLQWPDLLMAFLIGLSWFYQIRITGINRRLKAMLLESFEREKQWRTLNEEMVANFRALKIKPVVHTINIGHEAGRN